MLTIYYVHTVPSMPSQTVSHMLPAAQAGSTDNTSYTHPPTTDDINTAVTKTVVLYVNRCERLIRTFMRMTR